MEVPGRSVYTPSGLHPNCDQYCALFATVPVSVLSDQFKFQMTRTHLFYLPPPASECAAVVNISSKMNAR